MCAITGLFSLNHSPSPGLILKMTQSLKHRGPDDEGYLALTKESDGLRTSPLRGPDSSVNNEPLCELFNGKALGFLGHRRLSILDLSSAGRQPMQYKENLWITHNGEIYNYLELRQELSTEGYSFKTETDTEVILAAYDHWGEDCVKRFNGDWAFCIVDRYQKRLFLSRDRYGVKPFYYFQNDSYFAFSSEIKSLMTLPFLEKQLNREMMSNAMLFSLNDHNEQTLFSGVFQVSPGQNLTFDLDSGKLNKNFYYHLPQNQELGKYDANQAKKYVSDIRELLFDAVRLRLRADVSVGSCLSGGLDSSAIVAIMSHLRQKEGNSAKQHTFTSSFPGEPIDEADHARKVLRSVNAEGHFIYPNQGGFREDLETLFYFHDEPLGGPSVYSQREVMREASQHVKVTLDGQGADEVFSGYRNYRVSYFSDLLKRGHLISFFTEMFSLMRTLKKPSLILKEIKSLPFFILGKNFKRKAYRVHYQKDFAKFKNLYGYDDKEGIKTVSKFFSNNVNEMLAFYMTQSSLPHLLKYAERNSMSCSIEARVPFTDYRLVDYVFPIPTVYKMHKGWTKWLLRLAVDDILPKEITWRKDKLGFAAPSWLSKWELLELWLKSNQLKL
ncbi:MAG: asparagine synthase (glutamine-hydrolyzing) [Nitrospinales bacterium]|jgi:asparagine synthase (glutamine-hydrolysing)